MSGSQSTVYDHHDPEADAHTDFGSDRDYGGPTWHRTAPDPEQRHPAHHFPHVSHVIAPNHTVADTADTAVAAAFTRAVLDQHRSEATSADS